MTQPDANVSQQPATITEMIGGRQATPPASPAIPQRQATPPASQEYIIHPCGVCHGYEPCECPSDDDEDDDDNVSAARDGSIGVGSRTSSFASSYDFGSSPMARGARASRASVASSSLSTDYDYTPHQEQEEDSSDQEEKSDAPPRRWPSFRAMLSDSTPQAAAPQHDALGINSINFASTDQYDPNVNEDDDLEGLQSEEEGDDAFDSDSDSALSESESEESDMEDEWTAEDAAEFEKMGERIGGSSRVYDEDELREMARNGWTVLPDSTVHEPPQGEDDKKYDGYTGMSPDIEPHSHSILDLFFYFLPMVFWRHVASECNRYWRQTLNDRVDKAFERDQASTSRRKKTKEQIHRKLSKFALIQPHEIVRWIGLMIAHVLFPTKRMREHWSTKQVGVLPTGTFGDEMSRETLRRYRAFCTSRTIRHRRQGQIERGRYDRFLRRWKRRSSQDTCSAIVLLSTKACCRHAIDTIPRART